MVFLNTWLTYNDQLKQVVLPFKNKYTVIKVTFKAVFSFKKEK